MRFEVRVEEIDGSFDIVPVWATSEQEAIDRTLDWIDAIERRPMYDRPASAEVIGTTREDGDLSDAITSHDEVAHRRVSADGRELGTIRRPVTERIVEVTETMWSSESEGWKRLRAAMEAQGLEPEQCAVASEILDATGDPLSGVLITREGHLFGFVRDRDGQLSVAGGGEVPESTAHLLAAVSKIAVEILNERGR